MKADKNPYPKCIVSGCQNRAKRWDGGGLGAVMDVESKFGIKPGYIVWICRRCDSGHNYFDLPDNLTDALRELVLLREKLQNYYQDTFELVEESRAERRKKKI